MEWWTAFTIGLLGSLHCAGMCGPIAIALPYQAKSNLGTVSNVLLYNFGRILTYGFIGILPGIIGTGMFIGGYQKSFSIIIGILFLITAFFSFSLESKLVSLPFIKKTTSFVQNRLGQLLGKNSRSFLGIGVLNGFLPCGLVYMGVAGAITQANIMDAMLYMMLFGVGTIPMMMGLAFMGHLVGIKFRRFFKRIVPVFLVVFALLFILRGLNVDLPLNLQSWIDRGSPMMGH